LNKTSANDFEIKSSADHNIWKFMQLFTYSGSKLLHARSIVDFEAGDPVFFSFFENCVHKIFSKLQLLRVYIRSHFKYPGIGPSFSTEYVKQRDMMTELVERLLNRRGSKIKDADYSRTMVTFWSSMPGYTLT
jgi:hypothetical protein